MIGIDGQLLESHLNTDFEALIEDDDHTLTVAIRETVRLEYACMHGTSFCKLSTYKIFNHTHIISTKAGMSDNLTSSILRMKFL